jgi:hypothetical protein
MLENDQEWPNGSEVFFLLHNQKIIEAQKYPPEGFYIRGIIDERKFVPKSTVLGAGELAKSGRFGWLELNSRKFHVMESDKKALTPFVKGYMTDHGFMPSIRDVYQEP